MRVFVYEFVTGGGWWTIDSVSPPSGSLLAEALAMVRSLARDFTEISEVQVFSTWDARLPAKLKPPGNVTEVDNAIDEPKQFEELATGADYVLVIAPEFDGHLLTRVSSAEKLNCRLLSPGREFVAIASDKHATAESLSRLGVPVPRGVRFTTGMKLPSWLQWPAVLKPCDGAGSMDVRLVHSVSALSEFKHFARPMRLEQYCPGMPASIALLCRPLGPQFCPAGRQILSESGDFQYLGGEFPLPPELNRRATALARAVTEALPKTNGYVGIDLVLGNQLDGSQDYVIEVNPRLTTSYFGLRQLCHQNLAGAMLAIARGESIELSFDERLVRFDVCNLTGIMDEGTKKKT